MPAAIVVGPDGTPGARAALGIRAPAPFVDVDRELRAQYLAAVVRELDARGLHVDTAVLDPPARGGMVIFAGLADAPVCARWDGGRRWTVLTGQAPGTGGRHTQLRRRHTPAPGEVADFVVRTVTAS